MTLPPIATYRNAHETYKVFEIVDNKTQERYVRMQEDPQCHNHCAKRIDDRFVQETLEAKIEVNHLQFRVSGLQHMVANNLKQKITLSPHAEYPPLSAEAKQTLREYTQTLFPEYEWIEHERKESKDTQMNP